MTSKLQHEIKQAKPFELLQAELWLNLARTAATLGHTIEQQLRPSGLSLTQYNVLRILRGAGEAGLCQWEIGSRLVAQVPDVPRILNRMERAGLVRRQRGTADRRVVTTTLTTQGAELLEELEQPMRAMMSAMFAGMNEAQMRQMIDLLVLARS